MKTFETITWSYYDPEVRHARHVDIKVEVGDTVRLISWAGPCLTRTVVSIGQTRFKFDNGDFAHFEYAGVHKEPCERCTDHPHTQYPRGYEG